VLLLLKFLTRLSDLPNWKLIESEVILTVDGKFKIEKHTVKVHIMGSSFLAEVHCGSYRERVWKPDDVWVQFSPDKTDAKVKSQIDEATAQARTGNFHTTFPNHLVFGCEKCRQPAVVAAFKDSLLLPDSANVDILTTVKIATRQVGSRPVDEDLTMLEMENYELCILHGTYVTQDEEPLD